MKNKTEEFKWIKIIEMGKSKSGITSVFEVINKIFKDNLGIIKWNSFLMARKNSVNGWNGLNGYVR